MVKQNKIKTKAKDKPSKSSKKIEQKGMKAEEAEEQLKKIEKFVNGSAEAPEEKEIKASKPVSQIKKGDKMWIDGKEYEVDSHYVLIDHGATKEMAIEIFDPKTDKDFQLRYFSDQIETSIGLYELQEIMYFKRNISKIEW